MLRWASKASTGLLRTPFASNWKALTHSWYRQIRQLRGERPAGISPHWQGAYTENRRRLIRIGRYAWSLCLR